MCKFSKRKGSKTISQRRSSFGVIKKNDTRNQNFSSIIEKASKTQSYESNDCQAEYLDAEINENLDDEILNNSKTKLSKTVKINRKIRNYQENLRESQASTPGSNKGKKEERSLN